MLSKLKNFNAEQQDNNCDVTLCKNGVHALIGAVAITVHKLQGRSLEKLFVFSWSYTSNWIYVLLSRVKTSTGLFVRTPLSEIEKTSFDL